MTSSLRSLSYGIRTIDQIGGSYLLLDLQRNATDNVSLLDSLHEMGCISSDLIPQPLGGDLADLLQDELIILEIAAQLRVVFLDELLGSFLNCLCANTSLYNQPTYRVLTMRFMYLFKIGYEIYMIYSNRLLA